MSTLKDVYERIVSVEQCRRLFGATEAFSQEFDQRIRQLGEAICADCGIDSEQAKLLPRESRLGKTAQQIFGDLETWLGKQHQALKPAV